MARSGTGAAALSPLLAGYQPDSLSVPAGGITLTSGAIYRDMTINATGLTASHLFNGSGVSNVEIRNVKITGLAKTKGAFTFTNCTNIRVQNVTQTSGGKGITFDACDDVMAIGNDITLTTDATSGFVGHGVLFYANSAAHSGAVIANNRITATQNYSHGIYAWGSDSATVAGPVYASDITVTGNIIDTAEGGIWFSKCQDVTVSGNTVRNCDDVGIDFEGCVNCASSGNTVVDARVGGLATLYNCKGITFTGDTVLSTLTSLLGGGNNVSASSNMAYIRDENQDVTFAGCVFRSTGASRCGDAIIWKNAQAVASHRTKFVGCKFYNATILQLDLGDGLTVDDCEFYADWDMNAAGNPSITAYKTNRVRVRGCVMDQVSNSAQAASDNYSTIYIDQSGAAAGTYQIKGAVIERNEVRNMAGIYVSTKTGSSPDGGDYVIRDNLVTRLKHSSATATAGSVSNNLVPSALTSSTVTTF